MNKKNKTILVLGSNFAGVTAAIELKRKLGKEHQITVISPSLKFLYVPSLIWVPFGKREVKNISFEIAPVLEKKDIKFIHDEATKILPEQKQVETLKSGTFSWDYLVVATGVSLKWNILENLDPQNGIINCIVTPKLAENSFENFKNLLKDPGPIVVGATQGASCMGAAYEYLFNLERELRRHKIRNKVDITWITPEPFLGHFGIGGITGGQKMLELFMKMFNIHWKINAVITKIEKNRITLKDGSDLPFKMAMLIPPFEGADVVKNSPGLADEKGFIECNDGYQSLKFPQIYAAGLAVQVKAPFQNCVAPFGVPKTGFPSDVMGKIVAKNIRNDILGIQKHEEKAFGKIPGICIMDAGDKEVWILTNHLFKPRQFEIMIPNVIYNVGKRILEWYMLFKNKHGLSWLP